MSKSDLENQLLKSFLEAVLKSTTTSSELREAARALRSSDMLDRLVILLETLAGRPETTPQKTRARLEIAPATARESLKKSESLPSSDEAFDLVKRRKVNKSQLYEIYRRVDSEATPPESSDITVRDSLGMFKSSVNDNDWLLFISIIEGRDDIDPFLKGILKG